MRRFFACVVVVVLAAPLLFAATYYLSPDGDDGAPGDRARPWQTIEHVNKTVAAGDTVVFRPGDHPGTLAPENDGEPGAPLTFRSEPPLKARLRGGKVVIDLNEKRHIVLDGLFVEPRAGKFMNAVACSHLTIQNCRFERSRGGWSGLALKQCEDVRFLKSVCHKNLQPNAQAVHSPGHAFDADRCKRLIIEDSLIAKGGHGGASITVTEDLVIRRSILAGGWGRPLSIYRYCRNVLFEENVITDAFDSGGSAGPGCAMTPSECIWRRNLVVHNWGRPLGHGIWKKGEKPVSELKHNRFYHNTIAWNLDGALNVITFNPEYADVFEDCTWKNNIFYYNDFAGCFATFSICNVRPRRLFVHNAILGDAPGRQVVAVFDADSKTWTHHTLPEAEAAYPDMLAGNRELAPRFVDARQDDFRLAPGSPCIDAAAPLARAMQGGKGREIAVDDARWFYDGFGIDGERGDLIFVGPGKTAARVVRADRGKNVLTLDRDLSWAKDDPVSLPYAGEAPDLGAMEHGAEQEPWFRRVTIPEGAHWTPSADPHAPLLTSDFESGSIEQWGMLWNIDRKTNTKHARADDTAAGGTYCLRTYAAGNKATLAVDVVPWLWEIDKHPVVRFAYRIPVGVPVGIWLRTFAIQEPLGPWGRSRVCIGGSTAVLDKIDSPVEDYRLIDDDTWHSITIDARLIRKVYPGLKYLRAFDFRNASGKSGGLGKEGDQFWFDDFAILPEDHP
ncbi:MAG: right-handed parallel beta-helix repeat-containing protein [Kiritimatiellae bacterium]|nr:right-handed parallel beta-helix repeat-containing protein [Kiritimatiellia bacterium]